MIDISFPPLYCLHFFILIDDPPRTLPHLLSKGDHTPACALDGGVLCAEQAKPVRLPEKVALTI